MPAPARGGDDCATEAAKRDKIAWGIYARCRVVRRVAWGARCARRALFLAKSYDAELQGTIDGMVSSVAL
jgi:hypothetical protein